jgi:hypothetical protein
MSDRREFEPPAELRGAETFAHPSATDIKAELERILASRSFARPAFESHVLQHLARWHLDPVLEERLVAGLRAAGLRIEERSSQP